MITVTSTYQPIASHTIDMDCTDEELATFSVQVKRMVVNGAIESVHTGEYNDELIGHDIYGLDHTYAIPTRVVVITVRRS